MSAALDQAQANIELAQETIQDATSQADTAASNLMTLGAATNKSYQNVAGADVETEDVESTIASTDYVGAGSLQPTINGYIASADSRTTQVFNDIAAAKTALDADIATINNQIAELLAEDLDSLSVDAAPARAFITQMVNGTTPLLANLVNAANPILVDQTAQDQIWNKSRDREVRENQRGREILVSEFASRGFTVPAGILFKKIENAERLVMENNITLSREVAIKAVDVAVANAQLRAQLVIQAHQAAAAAYTGLYQAAMQGEINIAQYIFESARAIVAARQAAIQALVAALDGKLKIYMMAPELRAKALDAYAQLARTAIQGLGVKVDAVRANASVGEATARIETDNKERLLRADTFNVQTLIADADRRLRTDSINLDNENRDLDRKRDARVTIMQAYKDIAASAFSALNTLTSISINEESDGT